MGSYAPKWNSMKRCVKPEASERENKSKSEPGNRGKGGGKELKGRREGDVSWVQKVNTLPDCSMLSAGRARQLGKARGDASSFSWTATTTNNNSVISGNEGWLLFFILIFTSLPQGTAWPYGKRLAPIPWHNSLCSLKAGISILSILCSAPLTFKNTLSYWLLPTVLRFKYLELGLNTAYKQL